MQKLLTILLASTLIISMVACTSNPEVTASTAVTTENETSQTTDQTITGDTQESVVPTAVSLEALDLEAISDTPEDYEWNESEIIHIQLSDQDIQVEDDTVTVAGSTVTITTSGTYEMTGTLSNGQITVDTGDDAMVRLILNGVDIHNESGAAIAVLKAEKVMIVLAEGSQNFLSDGTTYVFTDPEEDEPNATLFSKSDLILYGSGALDVTGNYNDGIASKDGLMITSGSLTVTAVDDGIRGKDYITMAGGSISVSAGGDGLKSDNEEDAALGFIQIETGTIQVDAGGDAISAQTALLINGGTFSITSGGGSDAVLSTDASAKGLKASGSVTIRNGTFNINSADDGIHSNGSILVENGEITISTGDDGIHADATLQIDDGTILITDSYEGLESAVITINGGNMHITASDDGINISGGNDGSGMMNPGMGGGHGGNRPQQGGQRPGETTSQQPTTQDNFASGGTYILYIHGGMIVVNAGGDGVDSNGMIEMSAGTVIVNGPTDQGNGALDYSAFTLTGGAVIAVGSSGMAQTAGNNNSQYSVLINFTETYAANTLIHIEDSKGNDILTFAPAKTFQSIAFSSPTLQQGETYTVYIGGSAAGTMTDGLYQVETYTPGSIYTTLTLTDMVTTLGRSGGFRP